MQTSRHGRRSGLREALALEGRSGTPEVHAHVPSLARVHGPKGAGRQPLRCGASSWSSMVTNGGCTRPTSQQRPSASLLVRCPRSPSDAIAQILSDASPPSRNRDSAKCVSSTPHSSRSPSGQTNGPIPRAGRPHGQDPMPRDRTLMVSMRPTRALRGWHLAPQPTHSGDSRSSARRNAMWPCARPSSRRSRSHRRCACG